MRRALARLQPAHLHHHNDCSISTASLSPTVFFHSWVPSPDLLPCQHLHQLVEILPSCDRIANHLLVEETFSTSVSTLLRGDLINRVATLVEGQVVHHHILKYGLEENSLLNDLLITMYNGFGDVEDALALFNTVYSSDLAVWNSFINIYSTRGMHLEVLQMLAQMSQACLLAEKFTFIHIISMCGKHHLLAHGKRVHTSICHTEYQTDLALGTSIINMYGKCESFQDARQKLHDMQTCNVVPWTAMISCYAQKGLRQEALILFGKLLETGGKPNQVTYVCILDVFMARIELTGGQLIHICIAESGFEADVKVGVALLSMYGRCGGIKDAETVFSKIVEKTLILWNAMICAFVKHLESEEAIGCFDKLKHEGFIPNKTTFVCILDACTDPLVLTKGKIMHAYISELGYSSDVKVGTALINMYGRCGQLDDINSVYMRLTKTDVVLSTSMIKAYNQHGHYEDAIKHFFEMWQQSIEPNQVTCVCVLDAFSNLMDSIDCRYMHSLIVEKGHGVNVIVGNALINMYGKLGCLDDALHTFEKLPEKTVVSWTAMVSAYVQTGCFPSALQLFTQMLECAFSPNLVTFISILDACAMETAIESGRLVHMTVVECNLESEDVVASALVHMYGKCGSMDDSSSLFRNISDEKEALWNTRIIIHAQQGEYDRMLKLFSRMEKIGLKPTVMAYVSLLDACSDQAVSSDGECMHSSIIASGFDGDANVATALMNMYGKCGNVKAAWRTFERINDPNVISWTSMIASYGQHGEAKSALTLFQKMWEIGIMPNKVTCTAVLDACSHAGMIFEAWECLVHIVRCDVNIHDMDHYVCIIDLLGRAGWLDVMGCFIGKMPFQPNVIMFTAMLGACRSHGNNVQQAENVARYILELDPENIATFVMLSNIYAHPSVEVGSRQQKHLSRDIEPTIRYVEETMSNTE